LNSPIHTVQLAVTEIADVFVTVGTVVGAMAFEHAIDEGAGELVAGRVAAGALAIGLAQGEFALVLAAVRQLEVAEAGVLVVLEAATVAGAGLLESAFAVAPALLETARVGGAMGYQGALALEQAMVEAALVGFAVAPVPLAFAVPLAIGELADIAAAIGIVDAPLALQQAIHHLPAIAPTVRQARVRRGQRLALSAGGEE
jgi:hypothetical protein